MVEIYYAASAPGKVILLGEHFVVYDAPALATAIGLRARAVANSLDEKVVSLQSEDLGVAGVFRNGEYKPRIGGRAGEKVLTPIYASIGALLDKYEAKDGVHLNLHSDIPVGAGLGSSAAVAVSAVAAASGALGLELPRKEIAEIARIAEKQVHLRPSGIDTSIATNGGTIEFSRSTGAKQIGRSRLRRLILVNTGMPRRTSDIILKVAEFRLSNRKFFGRIAEVSKEVVQEARAYLRNGDMQGLGEILYVNHLLLTVVGASTRQLDDIVDKAMSLGSLGAKMTGGGGGGCAIALAKERNVRSLAKKLAKFFHNVFVVQTGTPGVLTQAI